MMTRREFLAGSAFVTAPALVTRALVTPALVTPALVTPALVTPALVTPALVVSGFSRTIQAQAQPPVNIRLALNYPNGQYYFDPVGVLIPVGGTVRWGFPFSGGVGALMGITISAFHPANDNHELRIPEQAQPFDSGPMNKATDGFVGFEHTFTVEGTYDYFSASHEVLGMVGRIVVGKPGGPAEQAPGYGGRDGRAVVYPAEAAILAACPSAEIVARKTIPYPRDIVKRLYPFGQK